MALLIPDRITGQPMIYNIDVEALKPGELPQKPSGPYLFEFDMDDGRGPRRFEGTVMMTNNRILAAFRSFPVVAMVFNGWTIRGKVCQFMEVNMQGQPNVDTRLMELKAELFGRTHIWLDIDRGTVTGGLYDNRDNSCWSLPFYNFYNDGRTCLGGLEGTLNKMPPLQKLYTFLSAYTTPHVTYNDQQGSFKPDNDQVKVVSARVPKHYAFDYPIDKDLFGKPIAAIRPC